MSVVTDDQTEKMFDLAIKIVESLSPIMDFLIKATQPIIEAVNSIVELIEDNYQYWESDEFYNDQIYGCNIMSGKFNLCIYSD